jgi:hypothetical protein
MPVVLFEFSEDLQMTLLRRPINVFIIHTHRDKETVHTLYARIAKDAVKSVGHGKITARSGLET